ncbi:MAG: FAD-dependent oxidoreductase, partial [Rhizobiaceae bacterium]
ENFNSRAELRSNHEIYLSAENKIVTAEKILIAVGGTPNNNSALQRHELGIVSDQAFDLASLPKSIIIVGAGYIAVEFAGIFNGLGVDTTLVYRGDEILRGFDNDLRTLLHEEYEKRGIKIITEQVVTKLEAGKGGEKLAHLSGGEVLGVEQVMFAMGRIPLTQTLGLETAGVEICPRGFIKVDAYSQTNVDNIWAVGDVTNRVPLTPVAIHEAMCFVATVFRDDPQKPDHETIPTAVFSHPEIGTVGLSEEEAGEKFEKLNVFKAIFRPMRNTLAGRDSKMLMKIIVEAASDKVVGVHVLGADAGEMAQLLAIPMKLGATKKDFDVTMALHPSAAEELVTMYEPSYTVINGKRQGEA